MVGGVCACAGMYLGVFRHACQQLLMFPLASLINRFAAISRTFTRQTRYRPSNLRVVHAGEYAHVVNRTTVYGTHMRAVSVYG